MVAGACNPSYSGGLGRKITWTQEAEVAVSRNRTITLQPGQQEQDFILERKSINSCIQVVKCQEVTKLS